MTWSLVVVPLSNPVVRLTGLVLKITYHLIRTLKGFDYKNKFLPDTKDLEGLGTTYNL